jgi:toxin FitB
MAAQPALTLFTTTISQAEILYGVAVLPAGRRRVALQEVVAAIFDKEFFGRVLPFDSSAAQAFAEIAAIRRRLGRPIGDFDAQIAAIARSRGAAVATRNVDDFTDCDITVISPWNQ